MVINTPTFVHDVQSTNTKVKDIEGQKLFFAFMYRLAVQGHARGFDNTRYYIAAADMRYFLRGYVLNPGEQFFDFDNQYFNVGAGSDETWFFTWKKRPETSDYDFTKPEQCAVWGFLLGKEFAGNLTEDNDNAKIPSADKQTIMRAEDRRFFSYSSNAKIDHVIKYNKTKK
tara:strand:+ start:274 stop:786 length:513 start_codon:yes stop_codon:yes gene_type:complete